MSAHLPLLCMSESWAYPCFPGICFVSPILCLQCQEAFNFLNHYYISFCRSQLIWNNLLGKINTYQICVFPGGRLQVNDSCWRSSGVRGTFMHHTGAWIYLLLLLSLIVIPRPMCEVGWCCAKPVLKTSPQGGKWVLLEIDFEVLSFLEMWQL